MDKDDREAQALDDFWGKMEKWRRAGFMSTNEAAALAIAYDVLMDLRDPPGDPHKEWVDANKLKPNDVFQSVLAKTVSGKIGLAKWTSICSFDGVESWQVQLFMECWYGTKEGVTHWRYLPEYDDNG